VNAPGKSIVRTENRGIEAAFCADSGRHACAIHHGHPNCRGQSGGSLRPRNAECVEPFFRERALSAAAAFQSAAANTPTVSPRVANP